MKGHTVTRSYTAIRLGAWLIVATAATVVYSYTPAELTRERLGLATLQLVCMAVAAGLALRSILREF